jgi:hypothetical protein
MRTASFRARVASSALAAILLVELAPCAPARADGRDPNVQAVEALTNQAYELTVQNKYSEAIGAYMRAYELSHAGAILFNIATIYDRKLRERSLAMEYFRRYLQATDAVPDFARKAAERLSELKEEEAAEARARSSVAVAPTPATPATETDTPSLPESPPPANTGVSPLKPLGIVLGAIGLVGVGTSLGLGALAQSRNTDANRYCSATACATSQGVTLEHQAGDFATAATVTFISGASLLAIGVTLFLAAPRGGTKASAASFTVQPTVGASSGGLRIDGIF